MNDNNIFLPNGLAGLRNDQGGQFGHLDASFKRKEFSAYVNLVKSTPDASGFHKALAYLFETILEDVTLENITTYLEKIGERRIIYDIVESLQIYRSPYFGEMFGERASRDLVRYLVSDKGYVKILKTESEAVKAFPIKLKGTAIQVFNWLKNITHKANEDNIRFTGNKKSAANINDAMKNEILISFQKVIEDIECVLNKKGIKELKDKKILTQIESNKYRVKADVIADILNWRFNLDKKSTVYGSSPELRERPLFQPLTFFTGESVKKIFNPQVRK